MVMSSQPAPFSAAFFVLLAICISQPSSSLLLPQSTSIAGGIAGLSISNQISTRNTQRHLELRFIRCLALSIDATNFNIRPNFDIVISLLQ
jgi:hypothetical protein